MIRVSRSACSQNLLDILNRPYPDNLTELQHARAHYRQKPRPKKAYEFERYKEWPIGDALDELFHKKCAYCETPYGAAGARDIEHFRPKGGVTEAPHHHGYWWLAGEWSNLLPSCQSCNRKRRQLVYDGTMTLEEFDNARRVEPTEVSGKGNSFPLLNSNWVTDENESTEAEDPLLINPCDRKPDAHIEWVFNWDAGVTLWEAKRVTAIARPRLKNGADDPHGKASIAVFGLNRADVIRDRMARIREMQLPLRLIVDVFDDLLDAEPNSSREAKLIARLVRHKKEFFSIFAMPDKPYAAMARAFIEIIGPELSKHGEARSSSSASDG